MRELVISMDYKILFLLFTVLYITQNLPFKPFLSVQFCGIKYSHIGVQPAMMVYNGTTRTVVKRWGKPEKRLSMAFDFCLRRVPLLRVGPSSTYIFHTLASAASTSMDSFSGLGSHVRHWQSSKTWVMVMEASKSRDPGSTVW